MLLFVFRIGRIKMSKINEYDPVIDSKTLQYSQDDVDVKLAEQRIASAANIRKHWPWQFNDLTGIAQVHEACLNATRESK